MEKPAQQFPTMFNLRRSGVSRGILNIDADPKATWHDRAMERVKAYANFNAAFMAEDVGEWSVRNTGLPAPPEPRAWGGVMYRAWRDGWIEPTGHYAQTTYGTGNKRGMRLWRSATRP